jgi:uncharacterized protein YceH (UPF0502 family)
VLRDADVNNRELAVLTVLRTRSADGGVKTRTERLYAFDDWMASRRAAGLGEGLAVLLPRQAGMREPRWGI